MVAGAGGHPGGAGFAGLHRRGGQPAHRPEAAARPRIHDARQPAGAVAAQRRRPPARPAARGRRRHRGRFGRVLGQDPAGRRLLLDRQRPGGADTFHVRRCAAGAVRRARGGQLRARPGRRRHPLRLLQQPAHRRSGVQRPDAGAARGLPPDRPHVVGRQFGRRAARHPARTGRTARSRAPGGDPDPRHPGQPPGGGRQARVAEPAHPQRAGPAGLAPGREQRATRRRHGPQLRRPGRVPVDHARGDRVFLRLAPPHRTGGAAPGRRAGPGPEHTRRHRPAGAPAGAFHGRAGGAHGAAGTAAGVAALAAAPRLAPADAGHAQRRLVRAHAGAFGRRQFWQRAGGLWPAVSRPAGAPAHGRHARLHPAAGRPAGPEPGPAQQRTLAGAGRSGRAAARRRQPLAQRRDAAQRVPLGRAHPGGAGPGRGPAPPAGRPARRDAAGLCRPSAAGGGSGALHARRF